MWLMKHHQITLIATLAVAVSFFIASVQADADVEFLDGLRKRRLFSLAESHCLSRLGDDQLDDGQRAQLTIELIRIHSAHAINSVPDERDSIWQKAYAAADQFIIRQPNNPRLILVRVQQALAYQAHGQLVRQELEAGAALAGAREKALTELRQAAKLLEEIDKDLTKEIPLRRRKRDSDKELSADELFSLQNNVRYQLARTYRNRALCYDPESIDRIDALTRVIEQNEELLSQVPIEDPLRMDIQLESIICQRLLGKYEDAQRNLTAVQSSASHTEQQLLARAELIRLELAQQRMQVVQSIMAQGRQIDGEMSAELDFAFLEALQAFARDSAEEKEVADWQKKAVTMARVIEASHGAYWSRRANLLLVGSAGGGGTQDLEILIRVADNFYVKQQYDEAIQAYEKAAAQAATNHDAEQSFALLYKAALVEHGRKRNSAAVIRLRKLSLAMSSYAKAPDAHLLAAWLVSQLAAQESDYLALYTELLEEHVTSWPEWPSADKARMWLARLRQYERAWNEAIDIYLEVSPNSDQYTAAIEAAARCSRELFAQLRSEGQPFESQAKLSAQRFEDLIYDENRHLPNSWTDAQRTAAVAAAKIRLQFISNDHATAGTILEAAVKAAGDAPESWRTEVRSLLVVALAGQPSRRSDASQLLKSVADGSPGQLLGMLDGLTRIGASARKEARVEIAKLQLDAITALQPVQSKLSDTAKLRLNRINADALAASGNLTEALSHYESLAKVHPRNGQIQEGYAELLLESGDKSLLEKSLVKWREIDRGSRPQSERWYRAKYSVALCHYRLGDKQRTVQLIEYLKITPPGLEKTSLKPQFEALLRQAK